MSQQQKPTVGLIEVHSALNRLSNRLIERAAALGQSHDLAAPITLCRGDFDMLAHAIVLLNMAHGQEIDKLRGQIESLKQEVNAQNTADT